MEISKGPGLGSTIEGHGGGKEGWMLAGSVLGREGRVREMCSSRSMCEGESTTNYEKPEV